MPPYYDEEKGRLVGFTKRIKIKGYSKKKMRFLSGIYIIFDDSELFT